jgi:hypothetical protein
VCGDRREDVATVERAAHRLAEPALVLERVHARAGGAERPLEHAVVRTDEVLAVRRDAERESRRTDTRIDDGEVHGAGRKVRRGGFDDERLRR